MVVELGAGRGLDLTAQSNLRVVRGAVDGYGLPRGSRQAFGVLELLLRATTLFSSERMDFLARDFHQGLLQATQP